MKRFRTCIILLAIAAAVNVLIAYICILWSPYTNFAQPPDPPPDGGYPPLIIGPYGQEGWWFTCRGFGVWQAVPAGARGANGDFLYYSTNHTPAYYRGGFPMLSMQSSVEFHDYKLRWDLPFGEIVRRGLNTSDLPKWTRAQRERRLPLIPFLPGFAVNTLIYFAIIGSVRLMYIHVAQG